jgi:hypothetical protein
MELVDGVGKGQERIVGANLPLGGVADLLQVPEDSGEPFVCRTAGLVGVRDEPVHAIRQGGGDHEDLVSLVEQEANAFRNLFWILSGGSDGNQEAREHGVLMPPRGACYARPNRQST